LITGGLGGLGILLADFLLRQCGLGEVILASRSTPKQDIVQQLKNLEAETGGVVRIESLDASKEDEVQRLLGRMPFPGSSRKLAAIYHLAGVVDLKVIADLKSDTIANAMAAKTDGANFLDKHSRAMEFDLKHFVLFSSICALLPFERNSSYTASNLYLDGLAQFRRGLGFHAISINWGAWSGAGMASDQGPGWAKYWKDLGMHFCQPELGLPAMATLIANGETNAGVFEVDWSRYAAAGLRPATQLMTTMCPKLAAEVVVNPVRASSSGHHTVASRPTKHQEVADILKAELAELLDCKAADVDMEDSFVDAGVDSIMLSQLRTRLQDRLGMAFEASALMQNPSVAALAAHISPFMPAVQQVSAVLAEELATLLDCRSDDIIMEDSFIEAGIDSIMLGQFRTSIQKRLGVDLDCASLESSHLL
jgi:acyl carrier protein